MWSHREMGPHWQKKDFIILSHSFWSFLNFNYQYCSICTFRVVWIHNSLFFSENSMLKIRQYKGELGTKVLFLNNWYFSFRWVWIRTKIELLWICIYCSLLIFSEIYLLCNRVSYCVDDNSVRRRRWLI